MRNTEEEGNNNSNVSSRVDNPNTTSTKFKRQQMINAPDNYVDDEDEIDLGFTEKQNHQTALPNVPKEVAKAALVVETTNTTPTPAVEKEEIEIPKAMTESTGSTHQTSIYRTMSSPPASGCRNQRRSSFFDYFIDTNPKTRRRTAILQGLIGIQIAFLVFLAVHWQEHLINPGDDEDDIPMETTNTAVQQSCFAILTIPLSFVFVLIVSSFITFVFASSIRL